MTLHGQTAIITGARGIGQTATLELAKAGVNVMLFGRDTVALAEIAAQVRTYGCSADVIATDLADEEQVRRSVDAAHDAFGRIDILLNAAGMQGPNDRPLWEISAEEFDRTMTVNVRSCFLTMKYVLPRMIERRSGRVVNIGGTFGLTGRKHRSHYSTSKWALRGLSRSAALEAGEHNVNVNIIHPGYIRSKSVDREFAVEARQRGWTIEQVAEQYTRHMALRRMSEPEDVAALVLFLVGDGSRNITGQEFTVDAGTVV